MTAVIAYAVSILLNLGVITATDVNKASDTLKVVEKDGKTVVVDTARGVEIIISA